jgi:prepilin-type N-terminal cleavage/methylation domain-containing protein
MHMKKGFTLIELLVAIGIFSITIAIAVGGFVHALRTQREIAALVAVQSNASTVLEQMARELRTGYLFCHDPGVNTPNSTCLSACVVSGNEWRCDGLLDFYNANSQNVDYRLNPATQALERTNSGAFGYVPFTGGNVKLNYLTFRLFGQTEGDHWAPRITIMMGVSPSSTDATLMSNKVNLQTTVSVRSIDCSGGGPSSC